MSTFGNCARVLLAGGAALWVGSAALAQTSLEARKYNIPTGMDGSPLFAAQPFTQKMLMFEEFGTKPVPTEECTNCKVVVAPS